MFVPYQPTKNVWMNCRIPLSELLMNSDLSSLLVNYAEQIINRNSLTVHHVFLCLCEIRKKHKQLPNYLSTFMIHELYILKNLSFCLKCKWSLKLTKDMAQILVRIIKKSSALLRSSSWSTPFYNCLISMGVYNTALLFATLKFYGVMVTFKGFIWL